VTGATLRSDPGRQRAGLTVALVAPMLPADRARVLASLTPERLDEVAELLAEINLAVGTATAGARRLST
jgi:hypothetical protein